MLVATVAVLMLSGPAQADCPAPPLIDTCLVGSWKQTGGGGEWMRQNLKMAQPTAAPSDGTLTFNADGTFSTSKVDSKAEVTVPGTSTRATGQMNAQASGTWSAAGGTLTLCMSSVDSKGSIEIEGPGGMPAPAPRCRPPRRCPRTPR